jgi:hypothetical protein
MYIATNRNEKSIKVIEEPINALYQALCDADKLKYFGLSSAVFVTVIVNGNCRKKQGTHVFGRMRGCHVPEYS